MKKRKRWQARGDGWSSDLFDTRAEAEAHLAFVGWVGSVVRVIAYVPA